MLPSKGVGDGNDSTKATTIDAPDTVHAAKRRFLGSLFPDFQCREDELEYEWSGIIGWSCDGLPHVGPLTELGRPRAGEYVCAGFSGHGMTQCFLAGRSVAEMILGQKPDVFVGAFLPSPQRTGESWGSANPADGATR